MGRLDDDWRRLLAALVATAAIIEGLVLADELRLGPDNVRWLAIAEAREDGLREFRRRAYVEGLQASADSLYPADIDADVGVPNPPAHRWIHRDMAYRGAGVVYLGLAASVLLRRRPPV